MQCWNAADIEAMRSTWERGDTVQTDAHTEWCDSITSAGFIRIWTWLFSYCEIASLGAIITNWVVGGGWYISVNGRICSFIDSCLSTTIHICCFCIFTKYTIPLYYIFLLCLIFLNITPHWYLMIGLLHWYHLGNSTSHTYRCVEALH